MSKKINNMERNTQYKHAAESVESLRNRRRYKNNGMHVDISADLLSVSEMLPLSAMKWVLECNGNKPQLRAMHVLRCRDYSSSKYCTFSIILTSLVSANFAFSYY